MSNARTWQRKQVTVFASIMVLAAVALPASARPRAPIVYVETGAATRPVLQAGAPLSNAEKSAQRMQFVYPGSPVGAARIELASAPQPALIWSQPGASLSEPPQFSRDTSVFDAASTAAKIGAGASRPVIESTPLEPLAMSAQAASQTAPAVQADREAHETGIAIIYGDEFAGLPTANGEIFDQNALTAAHPSLPLPSLMRVRNPATGREVVVRVNDRGPFENGAALQVSREAARRLGFEGAGTAELTYHLVDGAGAPVSDARYEVKGPVVFAMARTPQPAPAGELLGGDELAGGTEAAPTTKRRVAVQWPEPPADWDVSPAARPLKTDASDTLFVQLASFSDIGNAETLYRGLKGDLPVQIVPARVNGTDFFRVRVGPLDSRDAANQLRDRLNAEGKGDGRVVTAE
jgi:rare lipoprotein A